jgi:hypothetical protein
MYPTHHENVEEVARQTGNDPEQLCVALRPHFPQLDVMRELRKYTDWMKERRKTPTPRGFVRWLAKAQPELKPLPRKASNNGAKPPHEISAEEWAAMGKKFKAARRAAGLVAAKPEEPF